MGPRFVSASQDPDSDLSAGREDRDFDANSFAFPAAFVSTSGCEDLPPATTATAQLLDAPVPAAEAGSSTPGEGTSAPPPFALLDTSAAPEHPAADLLQTSTFEANPGSGSLNIIGAAVQETSVGLHIVAPIDNGFTGTADALFGPAASGPAPFVPSSLTSGPFGIFDAGPIAVTEPAAGVSVSHVSLEASTPAASAVVLAHLENGLAGSPITNAGVGGGGATASQVQQALDESGLSVNGSGIKVGVLSDSFNNLGGAAADEADGALPSASNIQILKDLASGGTDEGRAMMQIIHDIAPGASLAFYTAFDGEQDFANGILALAAAGAKVIVDDVGYFDEPFFQTGVIGKAIQTVEAEGVTYVTAAGNEGSNGYQASWTPISGTFGGQTLTDAESFGGSLTQTVTINTEGISGADVPLVLEWNQAFGAATSKLEILVFHNGTLVGTATNQTSGEPNNPWAEFDFTASGTYQVAIENLSGPNPGLIKDITEGDGLPATISGANSGTVVGHPLTPGAIATGAVSAADTPAFGFSPTSESFSSSGAGAEFLFANNGAALSSPQLLSPVAVSGVDDIATTVSGGLSDFYGTSASSASLAGVAALILSADPNLTPAQVEQIMEQTALPMSNPAVSGTGLVQVDPAVAAALALVAPPLTIESFGSTSLVEVGNLYFLDSIGSGSGPLLKQNGAAVVTGEFGGWTPIGVEQVTGGYDVAWKLAGADQYTVWSTDSNGNYISFSPIVSGESTALESFETIFHQDLNGDGVIGPPTTVIESAGSTSLVEVGNNFYLNSISSGSGPLLKQSGAAVVTGEFGGWTPIGAEQVAGGYDVAWKLAGADQYTVWSTDSNGNYISFSPIVSGESAAVESFEAIFHQDLNGDGVIGPPTTVIESAGSTSLVEVGTNFYLDSIGSGSGPLLKQSGAAVVAGEFGGWTPIGVEQVAGGYDVAWKMAGADQYTVWSTDSNGNYISFSSIVSGASAALESFETIFHQDLNGDGFIGPPVIESFGSTSLVEVGNNFYLDSISSGSGPLLKQSGAAVVAGEFGGWTPIGAEQVAGGYDVAWKMAGADQYTVWSTDSNGNYISFSSIVSGSTTTLESLENIFHQDLNGDGVIGIYAAPGTTLQINNPLINTSGAATIGAGATLELAAADSASVTFSNSTGMLKLDNFATFSGVIFNFSGNGTLSGSDQIDIEGVNFNSVHDSFANGVLSVTDGVHTATLDFNGSYVLANFKFANDGSGGTIVYDPPVPGQNPAGAPTTTNGTLPAPSAGAVSVVNDGFVFRSDMGAGPGPSAGNASTFELGGVSPVANYAQLNEPQFGHSHILFDATHSDTINNFGNHDGANIHLAGLNASHFIIH